MYEMLHLQTEKERYAELVRKAEARQQVNVTLPRKPSVMTRLLVGMGGLMVRWGTSLQARYGEARSQHSLWPAGRQLERVL